jgi:tetratricopeptide (TPR) repeat protein
VFSARSERYPADMRIKFELARRFMRCKRWKQAIPLLQRASTDVRLVAEVLINLGNCFIQEKQNALALRQVEKAVPKLDPHERPELLCEARYLAGRLCEETGRRDDAETHYSEVLAIDYEYKDARQRLERIQRGDAASAGQ